MAKKNALGRGLGALIETDEDKNLLQTKISSDIEIEVEKVDTNPFQPRTQFDDEALEELASSIKELGVIQPITVRELSNGRYQLITGERRLRAAKMAGLQRIPAYTRLVDDNELLEMALVENIQREDLNAIEIAISYQRLIEECNLTQESLSQRVGKKRATISNYLRLLKLPAEIQLSIREKKISMGHARALVNIEDPKNQLSIFYSILEDDLSVRKVEELVRNLDQVNEAEIPVASDSIIVEKPILSGEYEELKSHLAEFFKAKVNFVRNNNGAGKIVIPFKSDDELERIIAIFDSLKASN
ncbi:MAG: ParB/RepB/Spo0J family partition protein [Bacteroidales bacterium]|nr:ParB/RepB/Spo0J family partition protein [Bacteroidales bacterium]